MMKTAMILLGVLVGTIACREQSFSEMADEMSGDRVPVIRPEDLPEQCLFLDARELVEYETSHIREAIWIGYLDFDPVRASVFPDSAVLVVYCSVGYRSAKIAAQLKAAGYPSVYNLWGGLFNWYNEGRDVVNSSGVTDDIHPYNAQWSRWIRPR